MNFNLTCQKTHILAWANVDNTLSLKINGIKYLGYPKVDKRGGKYWKVEGLITPPDSKVQVTKEEIEAILNKPLSEQTAEDREKWAKHLAQEEELKRQESIKNQSQKVLEQLAAKITNHESTN